MRANCFVKVLFGAVASAQPIGLPGFNLPEIFKYCQFSELLSGQILKFHVLSSKENREGGCSRHPPNPVFTTTSVYHKLPTLVKWLANGRKLLLAFAGKVIS